MCNYFYCVFVCVWQAFGWCPNGTKCLLSHDTDLIILQDEKCKGEKRRKRKRKRDKKKSGAEGSQISDDAPENKMPHMEVDPEKMPDDEPRVELPPERTQESEQDKGESEGNVKPKNLSATIETAEGRDGSDHTAPTESQSKADTGTHRAGFDAFMTGFIFAHSCSLVKTEGAEGAGEEEHKEDEQSQLPNCLNKVYLSGKAAPLNVVKSTFSKSSKAHMQKMEMVWGGRV